MKNKLTIFILLIVAMVFSACGGKKNIEPEIVDDMIDIVGNITAFEDTSYDVEDRNIKRISVQSLASLISGMESGSIDYGQLPSPVANFITKKYNMTIHKTYTDSQTFSFGVPPRNKDLVEELDHAIKGLESDGVLDRLRKQYIEDIDNIIDGLESAEFETFEGAPTITFAVTGDLPPIDYLDDDKNPIGFSTALLSELGKRLKKNIKIIVCDSASRPAVLISRKADVLFWVSNISNEDMHPESFVMEGITLTEPYCEYTISDITK